MTVQMTVSLELLRSVLELPSRVRIAGVISGNDLALLTLKGPAELFPPGAEFVDAVYSHKSKFDDFVRREGMLEMFPDPKSKG